MIIQHYEKTGSTPGMFEIPTISPHGASPVSKISRPRIWKLAKSAFLSSQLPSALMFCMLVVHVLFFLVFLISCLGTEKTENLSKETVA